MPSFSSGDEYIAAQPVETQARLRELRALIRQIIPDATEVISYDMPTSKLGERRVQFFSRRVTMRKARSPRRADVTADGHARLSYRQADTLWKKYTPDWDLHQLRHTAISVRAAQGYNEIELKHFSGHLSLRSLEVYIAYNREAAKPKARDWERRDQAV